MIIPVKYGEATFEGFYLDDGGYRLIITHPWMRNPQQLEGDDWNQLVSEAETLVDEWLNSLN